MSDMTILIYRMHKLVTTLVLQFLKRIHTVFISNQFHQLPVLGHKSKYVPFIRIGKTILYNIYQATTTHTHIVYIGDERYSYYRLWLT